MNKYYSYQDDLVFRFVPGAIGGDRVTKVVRIEIDPTCEWYEDKVMLALADKSFSSKLVGEYVVVSDLCVCHFGGTWKQVSEYVREYVVYID